MHRTLLSILFAFTLISCDFHARHNHAINDDLEKREFNNTRKIAFRNRLVGLATLKKYAAKELVILDSIVRAFRKATGIEIAIVTIDTAMVTNGRFESYTQELANAWELGGAVPGKGMLIGICIGYKRIRIQNGREIENILNDAETKTIIDDYFIPAYKKEDYFGGTVQGLNKIIMSLNSNLKKTRNTAANMGFTPSGR